MVLSRSWILSRRAVVFHRKRHPAFHLRFKMYIFLNILRSYRVPWAQWLFISSIAKKKKKEREIKPCFNARSRSTHGFLRLSDEATRGKKGEKVFALPMNLIGRLNLLRSCLASVHPFPHEHPSPPRIHSDFESDDIVKRLRQLGIRYGFWSSPLRSEGFEETRE